MVAVPSAVATSTVNPPATWLSKVAVNVAVPSASLTDTSAMVTAALSSFKIVTVDVSVTSMLEVDTVVAISPFIKTLKISSASTLVSTPMTISITWVSPAVPAKVSVAAFAGA